MKYRIKESRNKKVGYVIITLSSLLVVSLFPSVISGLLAWHFATTQRTVTVPMFFNQPFTAVVKGAREQKNLTGLIRDALQNAGQLSRDGVTVESRIPVWLDNKTRRLPSSYRAGQVLEDRTEAKETKHWVIDRVHDDTRYPGWRGAGCLDGGR